MLFKLELPNKDKLLVPVRINTASNSGAKTANTKLDSLSDVLIRIADYLTQSPEDFYKLGCESLVILAQLVAAAGKAPGPKPSKEHALNLMIFLGSLYRY